MEWLTQVLEERAKIPPETKEWEQLRPRMLEAYRKGLIGREEVVAAFRAFAKKYPDKPVAVQALYDISVMYYSRWRDVNTPGSRKT